MWACRRAVHVACRGGARSASVEMSGGRNAIGALHQQDRSALRRLAIREPGPIEKSFLLRCPLGMRSRCHRLAKCSPMAPTCASRRLSSIRHGRPTVPNCPPIDGFVHRRRMVGILLREPRRGNGRGRNVLDTWRGVSLIYDKRVVNHPGTMALYRFYLFMADGHIGEAREAHCADDAGAITKSAEFIGFYPTLEIWNEGRKVARLSAEEVARAGGDLAGS